MKRNLSRETALRALDAIRCNIGRYGLRYDDDQEDNQTDLKKKMLFLQISFFPSHSPAVRTAESSNRYLLRNNRAMADDDTVVGRVQGLLDLTEEEGTGDAVGLADYILSMPDPDDRLDFLQACLLPFSKIII